jgi:AraC-type DNA-binding domain-containing proteins
LIHITKLWHRCIHPGGIDVCRPNGSGDYLFLFLRCPTEVSLHGTYKLVPENTFLLYEKGAPQIYRKTDGEFNNDWIHFDFDSYDNFFEDLGIPFQTPIYLANSDAVTDMTAALFIEFFEVGNHHEQILDQQLQTLFYKFSDLYRFSLINNDRQQKYQHTLEKVRELMKQQIYLPESADELATTLGISTSYLQHIYKDYFHVTLQQDIIEGRVQRACCLLESTSYTIGEIGTLCGYNNAEHFSRQFKKLTGLTPMKYRKNRISIEKENT